MHQPRVLLMSARTGDGLSEVIDAIWDFRDRMSACGAISFKRGAQQKHWMRKSLISLTMRALEEDAGVQSEQRDLEGKLASYFPFFCTQFDLSFSHGKQPHKRHIYYPQKS